MLFTKFVALALPALALAAPAPQDDQAKANNLNNLYSKFEVKEDGTLVGPGGYLDPQGVFHQGEYTGNSKRDLEERFFFKGLFGGGKGGGGCSGGNCGGGGGGGGGLTVGIPGLLTTTFGGPGGGITTTVLGRGPGGGQVAGSTGGSGGGGNGNGDYIYGQTQQGQPWIWGPNGPQPGQPCATGLCPCPSCPPIFGQGQ